MFLKFISFAWVIDPSLVAIPTKDVSPIILEILIDEFSPTLIPLSPTFLKVID